MIDRSKIIEHMKVVGSDGQHVGTVDCVKEENVVLAKNDPAAGGKHHSFPLDWVSTADDGKLRLNKTADIAKQNWFDAEPGGEARAAPVCP
jgi:hypothetical protein